MTLEKRSDLLLSTEKDPLEVNDNPVEDANIMRQNVGSTRNNLTDDCFQLEGDTSIDDAHVLNPPNCNKKKSKSERKKKNLRCGICGLDTDSSQQLTSHKNTHRVDGAFHCSFCGKIQTEYSVFISHLNTHTGLKPYKCHTCGRQFEFQCLLKDHSNLHSGDRPHLCSVCGQRFALKASLKQHGRKHQPLRYKCRFCGQGASARSDLVKHERIHTGERPYMCGVCGEGYIQSSHLHDHSRMHLGERPYKCDVCSRGFLKKGDMQRHRRIHTGELPYLCLVCGKAFRQSTQCSNHVKNHHPDALNQTLAKQTSRNGVNATKTEDVSNKVVKQNTWCSNVVNPTEQQTTELLTDVRETTQLLLSHSNELLLDGVKDGDMILSNRDILISNVKDSADLMLGNVGDSDLVFNSQDIGDHQFLSNAVSFLS